MCVSAPVDKLKALETSRGAGRSYLSLGVWMSSTRQGRLTAAAALERDLNASFATLITCSADQSLRSPPVEASPQLHAETCSHVKNKCSCKILILKVCRLANPKTNGIKGTVCLSDLYTTPWTNLAPAKALPMLPCMFAECIPSFLGAKHARQHLRAL